MNNFNNVPIITQPKNLNVLLYKHQLASIYQMEKLEREQEIEINGNIISTRLGINADYTGYGKTLSMIGLILGDKMSWNKDMPFIKEILKYESEGIIRTTIHKRYDRLNTTLILVSPSIVFQWEKEIQNTKLKYCIILSVKDIDKFEINDYDIVITTPSQYNSLIYRYNNYAWKRFIFDEPGHVKVTNNGPMKEIIAGFYWFVTATPNEIKNRHFNSRNGFMKKIIGDDYMLSFEEKFDGMIIKNDLDFVKESFQMPNTTYISYECYNPIVQTINGLINPDIQKMLEMGDIEGSLSMLGSRKSKNLFETVNKYKNNELETIRFDIKIHSQKNNIKKLNEAKKKEEKILLEIKELSIRFDNIMNQNCSICLSELKNPVLETSCHNLFCGECILKWLQKNNSCPLCRKIINQDDIIYLTKNNCDDTPPPIKNERKITQIEQVIDIVKNNINGKFLIFSDSDATFNLISNVLENNYIDFKQIKGSARERNSIIQAYKNGKINVILLNTNNNGTGINFPETTDIIFYHKMSDLKEKQAIGRAERIGRKIPLNVHLIKLNI